MANTITFPPVSGGGGGGTGDATWGSITGVLNTQVDLRNALNGKQATLVSGTNIKTINGQDVLGSGDIVIEDSEVDLSNYYNKTEVDGKIGGVQADLAFEVNEIETALDSKVDKVAGASLVADSKVISYDSHIASASNPHNTTAGQVGAYTKAEVDALVADGTDLSDYYNKTEVDSLISAIPETDLSNYYDKTEVYNKLESYSKDEVDSLISSGGADLSDYYTKAQVDSLIPDISTKQDTLVSATNIKTINGESVLGSGDLVISGGGAVDLSEYYKKTETYSKVEVDTLIADIPPTDLSNYYDKTETYSKVEVENLIDDIPATDLSGYYDKTETETLLSNKVDKVAGKGLSTNDFTDTFKQALELNKVQNITTNSVTKKLVVTYTDGTFFDLNLDDVVTDVKVEGATLDATTNVLTILSSDGGADATVDLSVFVTNQTLSSALVGKADKVHTHTPAEVGLGNVDNTSDQDKPLSRAQSAALLAKFNLRNVAQEIGSDPTKVMSQKASTESFYRAGSGVQKAGKIYVQSTEPTENVEDGDIWLKI